MSTLSKKCPRCSRANNDYRAINCYNCDCDISGVIPLPMGQHASKQVSSNSDGKLRCPQCNRSIIRNNYDQHVKVRCKNAPASAERTAYLKKQKKKREAANLNARVSQMATHRKLSPNEWTSIFCFIFALIVWVYIEISKNSSRSSSGSSSSYEYTPSTSSSSSSSSGSSSTVWTSSSNGYTWNKASYSSKMDICRGMASVSSKGNSANFYYDAFENFYDSTDPSILSTSMEDAYRLVEAASSAY